MDVIESPDISVDSLRLCPFACLEDSTSPVSQSPADSPFVQISEFWNMDGIRIPLGHRVIIQD